MTTSGIDLEKFLEETKNKPAAKAETILAHITAQTYEAQVLLETYLRLCDLPWAARRNSESATRRLGARSKVAQKLRTWLWEQYTSKPATDTLETLLVLVMHTDNPRTTHARFAVEQITKKIDAEKDPFLAWHEFIEFVRHTMNDPLWVEKFGCNPDETGYCEDWWGPRTLNERAIERMMETAQTYQNFAQLEEVARQMERREMKSMAIRPANIMACVLNGYRTLAQSRDT